MNWKTVVNTALATVTPWKTVAEEPAFVDHFSPFNRVTYQLPNGKIADYVLPTYWRDIIMAVVTNRKVVYMVAQFRTGMNAVSVELPAGDATNKNFRTQMVAEVREELGIVITPKDTYTYLGRVHTNSSHGRMKVHGYLVIGDFEPGKQALEPTEDITVLQIPTNEVRSLLLAPYEESHLEETASREFLWKVLVQYPDIFE